ncbi:C4-dicarboxylate transport protein [Sporomusaceae bacterium FL31]|nr:C4-dicarboxylate transport protein [Sporomusaceae bacterium FL31]GCE35889.1 C4-dicarboxylate transport protein [Sporomusaceae bacterium]
MKSPFYKSLHFQVLLSIVIGIALGHYYPILGEKMRPLGDAFIKLIKMIIGPIIFCTIVHGIAGMDDMKKVGRVGLKALVYFEIVTVFALIMGLAVVNIAKPGVGMNVDVSTLNTEALAAYTTNAKPHTTSEFLMNIIPSTVVDAFAQGDILQILLFSLLFGWAMSNLGSKGKTVVGIIEDISHGLFGVVDIIMKMAPIGTFGAMAFTIGKYGIASLGPLGKLLLVFYLTCIAFVFLVIAPIAKWVGFSLWQFLIYIQDELLIVLGTASSESVLPKMMDKLERIGCSKSIVGLVIPTGYSFNLDGTSIYLTMAAIFVAQATNTELTLVHQLTILAVLLLTSKGASGVTGSGFIVLAATLSVIPDIPVAGLAVIFGVDRFMSQARAVTNLVGNGVATLVISKLENELDMHKVDEVLADAN